MRVSRIPSLPSLLALGAVLTLVACVPVASPLRAPAPGEVPTALTGTAHVAADSSGTVRLTVLWPERQDYQTQAIPLRTNALTVQVSDTSNQVLASTVLTRPQSGALPTTANLSVPAGPSRLLVVKAYEEQTPGFDSIPIAQGSASLNVQPSSEVTADLALVPVAMPAIASIPENAGPLATITITGSGFEGWGQPVVVRFGGVSSPFVSGSDTQLTAIVPSGAENGPITVIADGLTAESSTSFRVIRSLVLSPLTAVASAGQGVDFTLSATDKASASIASPTIDWYFEQTYPILPSIGGTPSTLLNGRFTPGSTGSYLVRVSAGTVVATASVTVN